MKFVLSCCFSSKVFPFDGPLICFQPLFSQKRKYLLCLCSISFKQRKMHYKCHSQTTRGRPQVPVCPLSSFANQPVWWNPYCRCQDYYSRPHHLECWSMCMSNFWLAHVLTLPLVMATPCQAGLGLLGSGIQSVWCFTWIDLL